MSWSDGSGLEWQPVELRCVLDPDAVMRRGLPLMVILAVVVFLGSALVVGVMVPEPGYVSFVAGVGISAAVVSVVYRRKRANLQRTYGSEQRLVLHGGGLRRFDGVQVIDIPWHGIDRFEWRNSSLPPAVRVATSSAAAGVTNAMADHAHTVMGWGIVGTGTITPRPGAPRRVLALEDRLYGSNLAGGEPFSCGQCLIFPAEFDTDWTTGPVAVWLRHFRPDLRLPATS